LLYVKHFIQNFIQCAQFYVYVYLYENRHGIGRFEL